MPLTRRVELKSPAELKKMRAAGVLLSAVFKELGQRVAPGVSTGDLDRVARKLIEDGGAVPAFLGYHGFPATLCTSVNDEVVHGIPSDARVLREGDVVSVDCGLFLHGYCADRAMTYGVGKIAPRAEELLKATEESLYLAIEEVRADNRLGDVGAAVQEHVEPLGFSVVRDYSGHGVGRAMHEPPTVFNYGKRGTGKRLEVGLVIAIEPMINIGTHKTRTLSDDWTVVTTDGQYSAHFEHTVAVTAEGPLILTA